MIKGQPTGDRAQEADLGTNGRTDRGPAKLSAVARTRRQRSGRTRRLAAGLLACAALCAGLTTFALAYTAGTAHAETYRYWGFRHFEDGAWVAAQKGPAQITPAHGDIEGWRYAISGESTGQRMPRATATIEEICGATEPAAGEKLVGVILDFGLRAEAPADAAPPAARAECAAVDANATSAQVLAAVASVRQEDGLICGIGGYPATGCGEAVAEEPTVPSPEPTVALQLPESGNGTGNNTGDSAEEPRADRTQAAEPGNTGQGDGDSPLWPAAVVAAILVLALGGFWQHRRRGGQSPQD